jgi:hypothetical protein
MTFEQLLQENNIWIQSLDGISISQLLVSVILKHSFMDIHKFASIFSFYPLKVNIFLFLT